MRDIAAELRTWFTNAEPFALATVTSVWQSAPRAPGAAMAVSSDGRVVGSVSGGCVEGAVYDVAQEVLVTGVPRRVRYGVSDDEAFAVGLTCGGEIELFVECIAPDAMPFFGEILDAILGERSVAVATLVEALDGVGAKLAVYRDDAVGSLGSEGMDVAVTYDARGLLEHGQTTARHYGPQGERRPDDTTVFIASFAPRPRMLVFGAIDFARAVAQIGVFLGYRVTVCDARGVFATAERFPMADEVVVEWPHRYLERTDVDERTVICVLTHDPKFDDPLLHMALRSPAAYVGAMGSRRTHAARVDRLRGAGMTEAELARLRAPIGLDIGARTPEETAVSVAAEIIRDAWGGSGMPLTSMSGRIHHDARSRVPP